MENIEYHNCEILNINFLTCIRKSEVLNFYVDMVHGLNKYTTKFKFFFFCREEQKKIVNKEHGNKN
jgi:hypothetical protein